MSNITQRTRRKKQNSLRNKQLSESAYDATVSLFEDLTEVSQLDMSNITQRTRPKKQNSLRNKHLSESAYDATVSLFEDYDYEEVMESLSDIAEEDNSLEQQRSSSEKEEGEEDGSEDEEEEEGEEEEEDEEEVSYGSDDDLDTSDTANATQYMLADSNPSSADNSIQRPVTPRTPGKSLICVSSSSDSPFHMLHNKLPNRLVSDLQKSCKSFKVSTAGITLGMGSANERRPYNVTSSLIGWAQAQNDPCAGYHIHMQYVNVQSKKPSKM